MNGVCCVIGGSGFIGTSLVDALLRTGRSVRVIGQHREYAHPAVKGLTYHSGDYGDECFLMKTLSGVDEIVDLAYSTIPKTSFDDPIHDIITNLPQAVNLYKIAASMPIRRILFVSSGGTVYGKASSFPITEEQPTEPISPYGITKLAIEKYAGMYHHLFGLPVTCLRPSNAYGEFQVPYRGQGFIATAVASIFDGKEIKIFGSHGAIRDYIYVEDVANGIIAALDRAEAGQVYNIGTGIGKSNRDVIEILTHFAETEGTPVWLTYMPERQFDVPVNILDSTKLSTQTGWVPRTGLEEGLERIWYYYNKTRV